MVLRSESMLTSSTVESIVAFTFVRADTVSMTTRYGADMTLRNRSVKLSYFTVISGKVRGTTAKIHSSAAATVQTGNHTFA